jgi:hypothetical protein
MGGNSKGKRLPEDLGRAFLTAENLFHALAVGGYIKFFGRGHEWSLSFLSGHWEMDDLSPQIRYNHSCQVIL